MKQLGFAETEAIALRNACCVSAISLVTASKASAQWGQRHRQASAPSPAPTQPRWGAESVSQAATQLYPAAETAAFMHGGCSRDDHSSCCGLEAVAEAVMQQGCCDEEGSMVHLLKPFLPEALQALSRVHSTGRCAALPLALDPFQPIQCQGYSTMVQRTSNKVYSG